MIDLKPFKFIISRIKKIQGHLPKRKTIEFYRFLHTFH